MRFRVLGGLAALALSGCANMGLGTATENAVDVGFIQVPDRSGPCARALEVRYHIINGQNPQLVDNRSPGTPKTIGDPAIVTLTNDAIAKFYTRQQSKYSCYAAALTTVWRAAGLPADREDFAKAADNPCGYGVTQPASFMQILYAANYVRTRESYNYLSKDRTTFKDFLTSGQITFASQRQYMDGRVATAWVDFSTPYLDFSRDGYWAQNASAKVANSVGIPAPAPQLVAAPPLQQFNFTVPNMYRPVLWYSTTNGAPVGGIYPVGSTDELVVKFKQEAFIIAGMHRKGVGHTVLITGLEFKPAGALRHLPTGDQYDIDSDTRITRIRYLDPAMPERPERWEADATRFLSDVDFMLAFRMKP